MPLLTSWLGDLLLRIVRSIDVRHREGPHGTHGNEGRALDGGEVVCVSGQGPLLPGLHRLRARCVERITHADEERALLDFDGLVGGMEVRRDLVAVRHGELDGKGRRLAGVTLTTAIFAPLGKTAGAGPQCSPAGLAAGAGAA